MSRDLTICQAIADHCLAAVKECAPVVPKCCDELEAVATFGAAHPLPGHLSVWLVSRAPLAGARRPSGMSPNTWTIGVEWQSKGYPTIATGTVGKIDVSAIDEVTPYCSAVHEAIRGALTRLPKHLYPSAVMTQDTPLTPKGGTIGGTFRMTMTEPRGES